MIFLIHFYLKSHSSSSSYIILHQNKYFSFKNRRIKIKTSMYCKRNVLLWILIRNVELIFTTDSSQIFLFPFTHSHARIHTQTFWKQTSHVLFINWNVKDFWLGYEICGYENSHGNDLLIQEMRKYVHASILSDEICLPTQFR